MTADDSCQTAFNSQLILQKSSRSQHVQQVQFDGATMSGFSFFTGEDKWLLEVAATAARLTFPRGQLAEAKRRWLSETRALIKAFRDVAVSEMPAARHSYEERAAAIGPLETLLLEVGQKLAAEVPDEDGTDTIAADTEGTVEAERTEPVDAQKEADRADAEVDGKAQSESGAAEADVIEEDAGEAKAASGTAPRVVVVPADSTTGKTSPPAATLVRQAQIDKSKPSVRCFFCSEAHPMCKCPRFRALPLGKRLPVMHYLKLCYNCYSQSHVVEKCPEKPRCLLCPAKHHTNLHSVV